MKNNKGVTLMELLVAVAIVSILAIALGFAYQGWIGKYRVESTIKNIYSDLVSAKTMAMTRHRNYFVDFPTGTTYRMSEDESDGTNQIPLDGDGVFQPQPDPQAATNDTDNTLLSFPKTIQYTIARTWAGFGTTATAVMFEIKGTIQTPNDSDETLCIRTVENPQLVDVDPDYNCIIIGQTRISMGRLNNPGGNCDSGAGGNCVAR